jgi:hypothetical protein
MGSKYLGFPSAGSLGCIVASVTAGTGWTRMKNKNASFNCSVEMYLNLLWKFLKPVSFSLIGKEVNFSGKLHSLFDKKKSDLGKSSNAKNQNIIFSIFQKFFIFLFISLKYLLVPCYCMDF